MKILLVGGTWTAEPNPEVKHHSSIVDAVQVALKNYCEENYNDYGITVYNGGCYYYLEMILNKAHEYDIVFWWANVPDNRLPKIRNVKEVAPHTMLVTSKRNDGIVTKGDANSTVDFTPITKEQIVGQNVLQIEHLGNLFKDFPNTLLISVVVFAASAMLLLDITSNILLGEDKSKEKKESESNAEEI